MTAVYGHDGLNVDMMDAFERSRIKRLLIAYGREERSDEQVRQHAQEFLNMGIECYRVLFPAGMDANDYALHETPAERSLGDVLRTASWMGNGKPASRGAESGDTTGETPEPLPTLPAASAR